MTRFNPLISGSLRDEILKEKSPETPSLADLWQHVKTLQGEVAKLKSIVGKGHTRNQHRLFGQVQALLRVIDEVDGLDSSKAFWDAVMAVQKTVDEMTGSREKPDRGGER